MQKYFRIWVSEGVFLVLLVCLLSGAAHADAVFKEAEPQPDQSKLVFTTFPSKGMGVLFERILCEAYSRIGYTIEVKGVPARRALVMSNEGQCDGEAARVAIIESSCENLIRVPTAIYTNHIAAFAVRDDIDVSLGWESVRSYRCASVIGYKYIEDRTQDFDHVFVRTYEKLFNLIRFNRVDIGVAESFDAQITLREMGMSDIRMLNPPIATNPMYHYLHKKHADLVPQIDKVLQDMADEGRLETIRNEMESGIVGSFDCGCE